MVYFLIACLTLPIFPIFIFQYHLIYLVLLTNFLQRHYLLEIQIFWWYSQYIIKASLYLFFEDIFSELYQFPFWLYYFTLIFGFFWLTPLYFNGDYRKKLYLKIIHLLFSQIKTKMERRAMDCSAATEWGREKHTMKTTENIRSNRVRTQEVLKGWKKLRKIETPK